MSALGHVVVNSEARARAFSSFPITRLAFQVSVFRFVLFTLALPAGRVAAQGVDSLRVPILVYHNIQPRSEARGIRAPDLTMRPEVFRAQMEYLKANRIPVVSLAVLVDALEGKGKLPPGAVVLTFDDGRVNQYVHAFPVLKAFGFTATFFPFTHAMDRNPRYFTWAQLGELMAAGMTVGSHTSLHTRVDRFKDAGQRQAEIVGSRELLVERLGARAGVFFSYPFGVLHASGDSAVRAAGYRAARAYTGGPWNRPGDKWRLRAVPMTEDMKLFVRAVTPEVPCGVGKGGC
jgi:peptidoglycan/xylan/chitin deacetylase (PgdA/CDA1 family)